LFCIKIWLLVHYIRQGASVVGVFSSLCYKYLKTIHISASLASYNWPKHVVYLNIYNKVEREHQPQLHVDDKYSKSQIYTQRNSMLQYNIVLKVDKNKVAIREICCILYL
jgi:hypothetical protein